MSDFMMQQIEQRMAERGIDLNLLSDEELSAVAVRFLGDAPPGHLPRETVITTLQGQKPIQEWAMGIKSRVAAQAAEHMTDATRSAVNTARTTYQKRAAEDPRLAAIANKFGEWLSESNYNAAQLTAMADVNQDGIISNDEILNLIRTMSNAEPPGWVVDLVVKHIDSDGNGSVTLPEWWAFLESIGFENASPSIPPVNEITPEPVVMAEAPPPVVEAPAPSVEAPTTPPPAKVAIDPLAGIAANQETVAVTAVVAATTATIAHATPPAIESTPQVVVKQPEEPEPAIMGDTMDHMSIIEALSGARLLSEFNDIVGRSVVQSSTIKVEKTERTLMASGEFRGGQTITGTLDGSEHVVTMRFPVSESEFIQGLKKGQAVAAEGKIYRWSGALKQANLECTDARLA
jgi:hypothetical protein